MTTNRIIGLCIAALCGLPLTAALGISVWHGDLGAVVIGLLCQAIVIGATALLVLS